jgi:hypothetical protein
LYNICINDKESELISMRKDKSGIFLKSDFYCTCCGRRGIPVARPQGGKREAGHLKNLFCLYCKREENHVEIRPYGSYTYNDFKEEFEAGRFYEGKRIPVKDLTQCSNSECEYNKHGRCWNSNYSFDCGHRPPKTATELKEMFENA